MANNITSSRDLLRYVLDGLFDNLAINLHRVLTFETMLRFLIQSLAVRVSLIIFLMSVLLLLNERRYRKINNDRNTCV